ncbi:hypothetical protein BC939DRAFT_480218 [Gamsiella multidivaricata]|uniref:uncharacterized protein n=1 Tax=Gamsiella multidivaricata TaxID=101098 RepID=UPI00221FEA13|nr:uncharacterized protein BC939DRAFT_480218 [Gamsiella multidivaricata]KAI7818664.1 hypothetical protein BC939DRAFT_480218 [Gamsiella multidivaricata]
MRCIVLAIQLCFLFGQECAQENTGRPSKQKWKSYADEQDPCKKVRLQLDFQLSDRPSAAPLPSSTPATNKTNTFGMSRAVDTIIPLSSAIFLWTTPEAACMRASVRACFASSTGHSLKCGYSILQLLHIREHATPVESSFLLAFLKRYPGLTDVALLAIPETRARNLLQLLVFHCSKVGSVQSSNGLERCQGLMTEAAMRGQLNLRREK